MGLWVSIVRCCSGWRPASAGSGRSRPFPGGQTAAWRAASRYVAGRSRAEALHRAVGLLRGGHGVSLDLFGELVRDPATADRVVEDYLALDAAPSVPPADAWLAMDLTHLALDVDPAGTLERLAAIAAALPPRRRVQVGAEDAARTDAVLKCVMDVAGRGRADRLGATVQANLLRSPADANVLTEAGMHVRLVKGAYVEASGAHPYGEATGVADLRLGSAWPSAARRGRWPPTTAGSEKRSCKVCGP